ncbi:larval cuticle protein A2B-like [Bombyx mandarina]|uniref:Larval cuticle protein A2B-like n=1 Tax=Bombyx mandarina TaxID=7092 RepID=A0A6J2K9P4_BOMMA|nr:larval cuticle protein A2B-like [Bombyx mandarina]
MMQKITFFSGLILSATCMVLHQQQPAIPQVQYDNPNYNFAYDVNDGYTGDIKSQHESRRGDTVLGQYSLLQPDGIRRTVDYRADDHAGFQANVNSQGLPVSQHANVGYPASDPQLNQVYQHANPTSAPIPVAVSRTSYVQTVSSHGHNLWA